MKVNKIIISLLALLLFGACEVEIENNIEHSVYCNGTIDISESNSSNFEIISLLDKSEINNNRFAIQTFECDLPQMLIVKNNKDEVVMLYRDLISSNKEIEINTYSTAIAFLTFHPALSTVHGEDYSKLVEILKSTKSFDDYLQAVNNSITQNKSIYDTTNTELINSSQKIFNELFSDTTNLLKNSVLNRKELSILTELYGCEPIHVSSNGRKLIFKMPGLYPAYKCTVSSEDGAVINTFLVPSRDNYGAFNIIQCARGQSNFAYGEEVVFNFPNSIQKANFHFKRDGFDLFVQLATSALQTVGAPFDENLLKRVAYGIQTALTAININLYEVDITSTLWNVILPIVVDVTLEKLSDPVGNSYLENFIGYHAINVGNALNVYSKIEGGANALLRILWLLRCENEYDFCAQYFNEKFGLCTDAKLRKVSGDNQTGLPYNALNNPIVVEVVTEEDLSNKNYIVKFITENGNGWYNEVETFIDENKRASYQWTLNENDENQYAWAQLIDKESNIILDSVKFTSTLSKGNIWIADITCDNGEHGFYAGPVTLDLTQKNNQNLVSFSAYATSTNNINISFYGLYNIETKMLDLHISYSSGRVDNFTANLSNINNINLSCYKSECTSIVSLRKLE